MKREELINPLRERYPADYELGLQFGACRLRIQANQKALIAFLQEYFASFIGDSRPADIQVTFHEAPAPDFNYLLEGKKKSQFQEQWVDLKDGRLIRSQLNGMVFVLGGRDHLVVGPCLENLHPVVMFINSRYIEWQLCQGCLLGHAAGVILKKRGLALAGFSGMGKSTLALHLMRQGAKFVSNNRILIEKGERKPWMYGVAELPRVNPGTLLHNPNLSGILSPAERDHYSTLPDDQLWTLEHKYDVPLKQCFGEDSFVPGASIEALILLNWKATREPTRFTSVKLAERADLWPAYIKRDELFFFPVGECHMPELSPENYLDYLAPCDVFELTGGRNFEKAVERCLSYIEKNY